MAKFLGRDLDEGLTIYTAASAAVLTSVILFYALIWRKQQMPTPTPLSLYPLTPQHQEYNSMSLEELEQLRLQLYQ